MERFGSCRCIKATDLKSWLQCGASPHLGAFFESLLAASPEVGKGGQRHKLYKVKI